MFLGIPWLSIVKLAAYASFRCVHDPQWFHHLAYFGLLAILPGNWSNGTSTWFEISL
jgi:hypothetical protein